MRSGLESRKIDYGLESEKKCKFANCKEEVEKYVEGK